jgi:GntR family transcriptional regulator/MocR family aminotransferase
MLPPRGARGQPFLPGVPALDAFPFDLWARLLAASWRGRAPALAAAGYGAGDPNGYPPLRQAIAEYLRAARAVRADAAQVFVVSGAQQAIGLAAMLLLDEGAPALVEDPGYPGVRGALRAAGAALVPVPVDAEGMDIAAGERLAPDARLACVAPSHQYPLGVTMSLARRLALLDWAARHDGWVIEDDYDSEYRYAGRPLTALQGLDQSDRVIYVGSFSKTLFPALRLGYLVVPPALVEPLRKARLAIDGPPAALAQPALARFMAEGHFAAHLRRMRRLYAARQEALLAAVARHLGGLLDVQPAAAGMHLVATPAAGLGIDDRTASARAAAAGIDAPALSSFLAAAAPAERDVQGLLLGFAAVPEDQVDAAVQRLAAALQ